MHIAMQVRSLLEGEKSLPKYDRRREGLIKEYEKIVRKMHTMQSVYVIVCFPTTPGSSVTPSTSRNDEFQSQAPCSS